MKNIVDFEMIFCTEHILLMYSKETLIPEIEKMKSKKHHAKIKIDENEFFENEFSENDFSNIENETHF